MLELNRCPRLYTAWVEMRRRCKGDRDFARYGGRGIRVCKRWSAFASFAADMEPHPGKGWSLDRKNNSGSYCKSNCRWATAKIQARNRRSTKLSAKNVAAIRAMYATGEHTQRYVGTRFGVCQGHVCEIIQNKMWAPTDY